VLLGGEAAGSVPLGADAHPLTPTPLTQLEEQAEVEAALVAAGRLLPEFKAQQRYWLGLRALLPSWQRAWIDPQAAPYGQVWAGSRQPAPACPRRSSCTHPAVWARLVLLQHQGRRLHLARSPPRPGARAGADAGGPRVRAQAEGYAHWGGGEPDNATGSEVCAVASFTQAYGGAWGWADAGCNQGLPFMCRLLGGSPAAAAGGRHLRLARPDPTRAPGPHAGGGLAGRSSGGAAQRSAQPCSCWRPPCCQRQGAAGRQR
jgi:hypothetical protein